MSSLQTMYPGGYGSWCQSLRCQMVHSVKRNIYFKEILFQWILSNEFHFMEFREIRFPWNHFISRKFIFRFPSNQFSENPLILFVWSWIHHLLFGFGGFRSNLTFSPLFHQAYINIINNKSKYLFMSFPSNIFSEFASKLGNVQHFPTSKLGEPIKI